MQSHGANMALLSLLNILSSCRRVGNKEIRFEGKESFRHTRRQEKENQVSVSVFFLFFLLPDVADFQAEMRLKFLCSEMGSM